MTTNGRSHAVQLVNNTGPECAKHPEPADRADTWIRGVNDTATADVTSFTFDQRIKGTAG